MKGGIPYIILFQFLACTRPENTDSASPEKLLERAISDYCQFEHHQVLEDHLFIFVKEGRWSPSPNHFLAVKKDSGRYNACYQEIDLHNDYYNRGNESYILFFNGFQFKMDAQDLDLLKLKIRSLPEEPVDEMYSWGMVDGDSYILYFDGKISVVNKGTALSKFQEFSDFLSDSLLNPIKNLRRDPGADVGE